MLVHVLSRGGDLVIRELLEVFGEGIGLKRTGELSVVVWVLLFRNDYLIPGLAPASLTAMRKVARAIDLIAARECARMERCMSVYYVKYTNNCCGSTKT
jgi:hypothetical protein